jgi:hypothetical protein
MSSDAVPEADAHDQAEPVVRSDEHERPRIGDETPEADAYEQSLPVPLDDEDDGRR